MLITKTSISITKTSQPLTSDTTLLIKLSCQVLEARRIIFFVNELWGGKRGKRVCFEAREHDSCGLRWRRRAKTVFREATGVFR